MNLRLVIFLTSVLILFAVSPVAGQEQSQHTHEFLSLLTDEKIENFLINKKPFGTFRDNFGDRTKIIEPNNDILIKKGSIIRLEESNLPEYGTILIEGTVTITDTKDYPLKAQKIIVAPSGKLIIGTNESPIDRNKKVEIDFVNNQLGEIGLFVFGELSIHGHDVGPTFVELSSDAKPQKQTLAITKVLKDWMGQSKLIITSAGSNDEYENCIEENEIQRIEGTFIHLKYELECFHRGLNSEEISSHVATLTRNVLFQSEDPINRGSINFFHGSSGYVKFAQLEDLGPKNTLGRYPLHFHHMKDTSKGIEVIGNSIVNSDNRWITIHDSNGILVKNNVGLNSVGHGFFLEDGTEFNNIFESNIGISTKSGNLIRSDQQSSVFWTMNPQNSYKNNVAIGGGYYGFHLAIPNILVPVPGIEEKINLSLLKNLEFENNISYNNRHAGLRIDRSMMSDSTSSPPIIHISKLKVMNEFRNNLDQWGIQLRTNNVKIDDALIVDSPIGIELNYKDNIIEKSIIKIITHSDNNLLIAGILISGQNNTIKDSVIEGYVLNEVSFPSDILISNSHKDKGIISGQIINSVLFDKNPIYFGNPVNPKSFLEVYGYDAPNGPKKNYPTNFLLQKIGLTSFDLNDPSIDLNFYAKVNTLQTNNDLNVNNLSDDFRITAPESSKTEILFEFKNQASGWDRGIISNDEFETSIKVLIESGIIQITFIDIDNLSDESFEIPLWIKKVVNFWVRDLISDQEFILALEYVLELETSRNYIQTYE